MAVAVSVHLLNSRILFSEIVVSGAMRKSRFSPQVEYRPIKYRLELEPEDTRRSPTKSSPKIPKAARACRILSRN